MGFRIHTLCLLSTLLLTSCSSVPLNIREAPAQSLSLDSVREAPDSFQSQVVRWGGDIMVIENRENFTELTVLARPLSKKGEPSTTDTSSGRFIVHIPAFIEPEEYAAGRLITVRGTVAGTVTREVGDYAYVHPVVEATDWYLWPRPVERPSYYYPWWYYDPWWYSPWYHYPYYYPAHPHHHHHKRGQAW
jgi:outer membrane lipoprotein